MAGTGSEEAYSSARQDYLTKGWEPGDTSFEKDQEVGFAPMLPRQAR
jgi:hypothetical protein